MIAAQEAGHDRGIESGIIGEQDQNLLEEIQIIVEKSTKKDQDLEVEADHQVENLGKRMRTEIGVEEMAMIVVIGKKITILRS